MEPKRAFDINQVRKQNTEKSKLSIRTAKLVSVESWSKNVPKLLTFSWNESAWRLETMSAWCHIFDLANYAWKTKYIRGLDALMRFRCIVISAIWLHLVALVWVVCAVSGTRLADIYIWMNQLTCAIEIYMHARRCKVQLRLLAKYDFIRAYSGSLERFKYAK